MFCKHKWKIVSHDVLPSPVEQMRESIKNATKLNVANELYFQKKVVTIVTCEKCGKIKQFSESLIRE